LNNNSRGLLIKIGGFSAGLIAFALSVYAWMEFRQIGFPDGFLSEWDKARKVLLCSFTILSFLAGVWFVYFGRLSNQPKSLRKLYITAILYVILLLSTFIVDYLLMNLSGRGG
jgi:RsiW-degrading membrane proteinase PrsW (M82 family)